MGSGFCTYEEAAKRLGVVSRTVHNYVARGLIKKEKQNGKSVLCRDDVESCAVDIETNSSTMDRKTFLQMQNRLKKLEDEMTAVKHILEIRDIQPLRPDQITCLGLIQAIQTYLHLSNREVAWTTTLIEKWSDVFERLDEESLSALSLHSSDPHAWVPFFKFCSEMADFCWANDRARPSLEWQARASRLDTARQHLRRVVVAWLEMGHGTIPQQFMEALGSNKEALIRRVAKAAPPLG